MGNLLTVLTSPTATFQRLKEEKGGWFLPMLVLIILSLIGMWLTAPVAETMIENGFKEAPEIDPDLADLTKTSAIVGGYVAAVVGIPVSILVGGLLLLLLNLIVNGEANYKQLVKVTLYSKVPSMISLLLTGLIARLTGATNLLDVGLNAGAFIEDKTSTLFLVLSLLDPFAIWGLVLLIIGSAVMMERPRKKVGAWIVGAWLVISLIAILANATLGKVNPNL